MNIFWALVLFLSSGLGAFIVSRFFKTRSTSVFFACTLGIPGMLVAYAAVIGSGKMLTGTMKFSFDNLVGVLGAGFLAYLLVGIVYVCYKAEAEVEAPENKKKLSISPADKGQFGIPLTPLQETPQNRHQINCPYCTVKLKIPQIYEKTEFRCKKCTQTFYVQP